MNFSFKKNIIIIVIAAVLALGIGGTVIGVNVYNSPGNRISRYLGEAERYLSEMNYEQAVIEFKNILKIEPMNVDAYLGLADAYIGMGDKEKALEVLREGLERTGDTSLQAKIDELTKPDESSSAPQSSSLPQSSSVPESSSVPQSSTAPVESKPNNTKPVFGSMGTATVAGTEIDIATTKSLFIINMELYEAGNWKYGDLADYESHFDLVINLNGNLSNEDLSELSRLSNLKTLEINYAGITDISFLTSYTNLKHLYLKSNKISDITQLEELTSLRLLYLEEDQINNITPLAGLTNLTSLYLSGNQISDISTLAGLTNLTNLGLRNNQISDISPLAGLTNLTNLQLGDNQITDITAIAGLTNLKWLSLSNNHITDADIAWLKEQLPSCNITT